MRLNQSHNPLGINAEKTMFRAMAFALGLTLSIAILFTSFAYAQSGNVQMKVKQGSTLTLKGTSTMHDYSSTSNGIDGTVGCDAAQIAKGITDGNKFFTSAYVKIPVKSMKSEHSGLDDNLCDHLKADKYPYIIFQLSSASSAKYNNGSFTAKANGNLTVAGVTKPVTMDITFSRNSDGSVHLTGKTDLLMSDFGVDPPTFMFVMHTDNKVTINFDLALAQVSL